METKELPSAENSTRTIDGDREERERIAPKRNALPLVDAARQCVRAKFRLEVLGGRIPIAVTSR